jgi:hypothetical protein
VNRAERVGRNEAFFREVNERVRGVNEVFSDLTGKGDFVCECGDSGCVEGITLTMDEYREVRSEPELFAIALGHELTDVEDVVRTNDRFTVVRKREGEPAEIARELA